MSATSDELQAAINQVTWSAANNAPLTIAVYNQLRDVASQLGAGPPLTELNAAINQLRLTMPNNASVSFGIISALNDVWSQLTNGSTTTNPPDVAAIGQLEQAIINQEPDWAPLLWINWTSGSATLTVQVRGIYTLTQSVPANPWWTQWSTFYDAASQIIATIYLLQLSTVAKFDQRRQQRRYDGLGRWADSNKNTSHNSGSSHRSAANCALNTVEDRAGLCRNSKCIS